MILIVSESYFKKHPKKLIEYKDYVLGDATDRGDDYLSEKYNSVADMGEFVPPPKLQKIVTEPNREETRIYRRNIKKHKDNWLGDEALVSKVVSIGDYIVDYNEQVGEDVNVFLILRKNMFKAYAEDLKKRINEILDCKICECVDKDMPQSEFKALVRKPLKKKKRKALKERVRKLKKRLFKKGRK